MYCQACGAPLPDSAVFCQGCGQPVAQAGATRHAGFWLRFLAYLIDYVVVFVGALILGIFVGLATAIIASASGSQINPESKEMEAFWNVVGYAIAIPGWWLYYALMERSRFQGTLGKMALGLKVTDLDGERISFGRATGRTFAKFISMLILGIGFIMAGFTEKKQALHDQIAGCLVVRKR